jgi:DNA-binding transcriptional ArsR family regulator
MSQAKKKPVNLSRAELERLAGLFRCFSEPTRLALLQELKAGPRNVGELVAALGCTQANVSKQLKALHQAGLLSREREASTVTYTICEPLVFELCELACNKLNRDAAKLMRLRF